MLFSAAFLVIFGLFILYSVSFPQAQQDGKDDFYFARHQLIYGILPGIFLAIAAYLADLKKIRKYLPLLLLLTIIAMLAVFLPGIGVNFRGSSRWLDLGFIGFQPSEFLKPIFIVYLASWLSSRNEKSKIRTPKTLDQNFVVFAVLIGAISLILALQPDISTLSILFLTSTLMYFLAATPLWHSILIFLSAGGGLFILIKAAAYRMRRITTWLNPDIDPMGLGFQMKHIEWAIGSGGLTGAGLGLSIQKFGALPTPFSDSIFAVFAEEAGLIGCLILIVAFLAFFLSGMRIVKRSSDSFFKMAAFGLTFWITLQAFANIASMARVLPLLGIPLPFVSAGGTAIAAELLAVGLLLNIARNEKTKI